MSRCPPPPLAALAVRQLQHTRRAGRPEPLDRRHRRDARRLRLVRSDGRALRPAPLAHSAPRPPRPPAPSATGRAAPQRPRPGPPPRRAAAPVLRRCVSTAVPVRRLRG